MARERYKRVLDFDPQSGHALQGLARIALLEGQLDEARAYLVRATLSAPDSVPVQLALADLEAQTGNADAARAALEAAVVLDPVSPVVHQQYLEFTGRAPRAATNGVEEALAVVDRHPYDPRARLAAGRWLAKAGRAEEATSHLETALWLMDLDPAAGRAAYRQLVDLDPKWATRRLVFVYVFADEGVRATAGWRFRLRNQWFFVSRQLDSVIDTWFVPVSIGEVSLAGAGETLESLNQAFHLRARIPSRPGIVAAFTGQPAPRRGGAKLGQAEFIGRSLIVRFPPGERQSRVLVHEVLHLYGGIHVADALDSIMNPILGSFTLDPLNVAIVREMRGRGFYLAGIERNVLAEIDVPKAIDAYQNALGANLAFRRLGVNEALDASSTSRFIARDKLEKARQLDPHLGDVSRIVAVLLVATDRPAEALRMLEFAAALYGRNSDRGKRMLRRADQLMAELERMYGLD